jgi:rubredoxin
VSERMTCPVCGAHTSSVWAAFGDGRPCPHCGAPPELMAEVMFYRKGKLDKELIDKYAEQGKELARVKKERDEARLKLREIADVLEEE